MKLSPLKKFGVLSLIVLSSIGCDQLTKDYAYDHIRGTGQTSYLGDTVHLLYAENEGVAFSLGSDLDASVRFWVFTVAVSIFLLALMLFVLFGSTMHRFELVGYSLVIGGGYSNVIDRIYNDGSVIDYIRVSLGPLSTAIFNLADTLILVGIGFVMVASWIHHRQEKAALAAAPDKQEPADASAESPSDVHDTTAGT